MNPNYLFMVRCLFYFMTALACAVVNAALPHAVHAAGYVHQSVTVTRDHASLRIGGGDVFLKAEEVHAGERFEVQHHYVDAAGKVWLGVEQDGRELWLCKADGRIENTLDEIPAKPFSRQHLPKIYLSPSRQPYNAYAVGNTNEMVQMEALAAELATLLETKYGCEVCVAPSRLRIAATGRPADASAKGCDVYLALHSNASADGRRHNGAEAYYYAASEQSRQLAEGVVRELNTISAVPPDGAAGAVSAMEYFDYFGYGEVRDPSDLGMIAVLAEVEYHDNPAGARRILCQRTQLAEALARAVADLWERTTSTRPER